MPHGTNSGEIATGADPRVGISDLLACGECGGAGVVDSGGVTPWGAGIDIPCHKCKSTLDNTELLGIVSAMNITFSKAQVARATEVSQFDGKAVVARKTFGDHSRFCASLEKTRFGEPCVFILDAEQRDENYPKLSAVVWQGTVDKLAEGIAFVLKKWGNNEVPAL